MSALFPVEVGIIMKLSLNCREELQQTVITRLVNMAEFL